MRTMSFTQVVDDALAYAMSRDPRILILGEDVPLIRRNLLVSYGPVIFLEHKLLSEMWLEFMGSGGRTSVTYDVPAEGTRGKVPKIWKPLPIGEAMVQRSGSDLTIISVGVGVHRSMDAAEQLEKDGISTEVIDLRTVSPLDRTAVRNAVSKTGHLLVVDEDYEGFGLSGEL